MGTAIGRRRAHGIERGGEPVQEGGLVRDEHALAAPVATPPAGPSSTAEKEEKKTPGLAGARARRAPHLMSYLLPHLTTGWAVDQSILSEEARIVCIRFGHDYDPVCMQMDEVRRR